MKVRKPSIPVLFLLLAAPCFAQTDYASGLASAKATDARREPLQRASEILSSLDLKSGDSAADVGAGAGYYTERLSSIVGPKGRIFAVEIREVSLGELRERVRADHLDNVTVIRGEPENPHLETGTLDGVLIVDAYHEMKEYQSMLGQVRNALKPGGRLAIADYCNRPDRSEPREILVRKHFLPPQMVSEELTRAGFEMVRVEDPLAERKPENKEDRIAQGDLWLLVARRPR